MGIIGTIGTMADGVSYAAAGDSDVMSTGSTAAASLDDPATLAQLTAALAADGTAVGTAVGTAAGAAAGAARVTSARRLARNDEVGSDAAGSIAAGSNAAGSRPGGRVPGAAPDTTPDRSVAGGSRRPIRRPSGGSRLGAPAPCSASS